jgi:hypothetical protein
MGTAPDVWGLRARRILGMFERSARHLYGCSIRQAIHEASCDAIGS